jgi:hypothetical protein
VKTGEVGQQLNEGAGIEGRGSIGERYNQWIGPAKRSDQPYQSHMPAWMEIAALLKPRRVAEFGMGN